MTGGKTHRWAICWRAWLAMSMTDGIAAKLGCEWYHPMHLLSDSSTIMALHECDPLRLTLDVMLALCATFDQRLMTGGRLQTCCCVSSSTVCAACHAAPGLQLPWRPPPQSPHSHEIQQ